MQPYVEKFLTRQHEMGPDHRLRVQCICNYMEEAAGMHADLLGAGQERLGRDHLAWALVKMRLRLFERPGPGEEAQVVTWPVGLERVQFRRDFRMQAKDERILATAVTQWVIMGTLTRRLERFPEYVAALKTKGLPEVRECGDIRIPALGDGALAGPVFPVRLADIDQNRHVNNGRYVDFTLEAAEQAGATGELTQLDIIFRSEGLRSDVIATRTMPEEERPGAYLHSLFRKSDGQELARSRTVYARAPLNGARNQNGK